MAATELIGTHSSDAPPDDHRAVLDWIDQAAAVVSNTDWRRVLEVDGFDTLDILVSPIYLSLLASLRCVSLGDNSSIAKGALFRFRRSAYRIRSVWRSQLARTMSERPHVCEVLFWPREITHVKVQSPVAAAVRDRGIDTQFLVCKAKTLILLRSQYERAVFTAAAWSDRVRQSRAKASGRLQAINILRPVDLPAIGRCISPFESVRDVIVRCLRDAYEAIANAHSALEHFRPRVLIVGNDITMEGRAACLVARSKGVPTVTLMHGNVQGPMHRKHIVDKMLTYGGASRRELIRLGMDSSRIACCGAPYLDDVARQSNRVQPSVARRIGLVRDNDPWVLIATSGPGHSISQSHHEEIIRHLMQISQTMPKVKFVAKLHRKDRPVHYSRTAVTVPNSRLIVIVDASPGLPKNIFGWLQGCPLVITTASTVAVEAMLMDVPVITMDLYGEIHGVDFIDRGATVHVSTPEQLESAVKTILHGADSLSEVRAKAVEYVHDAYYALDGNASARAADEICHIMNHG